MKLFLATCLLLCLAIYAKTQTVDFYGKEVAKDICNQYGMKDDKEAKECLDKICDAASIPNNFVLAPCTNIDNCFALYKNGYSYIVYDINFFNKIKTFGFTEKNLPKNNVDWAALTILAHEIGHHMCLHTTNPNLSSIYTPVQIELQADEYAGSVMYKLGATLTQAQLAMNNSDVPEEASLTHPGRGARLEAIAKGWDKEYKKNAARNGQVINSLQPAAGLQGMVLIEGGIFNMGSDNGNANEKPVHSVTISSCYMGKYEVTVAEFKKFIAATGYTTAAEKEGKSWVWNGNKWEEKNGINWRYDAAGNKLVAGQDNEPVIHVNWGDCIKYCQWITQQSGRIYRLPTEAEWEYAARGGNKSNGYAYSGSNNIEDIGWYGNNAGNQTKPVGTKQPNELGIYDMTGNVWEWCSDWYDDNYYNNSPAQNPQGATTGADKVLRGGSWCYGSEYCRASLRLSYQPSYHDSSLGFRVVAAF